MNVDVAIVGGGPAGAACAISLCRHAPSLSVALLEASHYDAPRIGETLPPLARPILEQLGVFDDFLALRPRETFGTASSWGTSRLHDNDFMLQARGAGWHVDRARFDRMLAKRAEAGGATLFRGVSAAWDGKRLALSNGEAIDARFVVDATGSASIATRSFGAKLSALDHLVSFGRFFDDAPGNDPRTVVESYESGWCYTAALPGGRRFAAVMTDGDLARRLRLQDDDAWRRTIAAAPHVGAIVARATAATGVIARGAESRLLEPAGGDCWLAVGDAASRVDPLSSQGITKALRSALFASYAIADLLVRDDARGIDRYRQFVRAEFDAYRAMRSRFYADERRWADASFWQRRLA